MTGFLFTSYKTFCPVVETSGMRELKRVIEQLINARPTSYRAPIGLIYGGIGVGKTTAGKANLLNDNPFHHIRIMFSIPPRPAPSVIADAVGLHLGENRFLQKQTLDKCIELIEQNEPELMMIDNAECLTKKNLQILQQIRERSSVRILLLGLPSTKRLIKQVTEIASDIEVFEFPPAEEGEILDLVLPRLGVRGWDYDPNNSNDRALGEYIWDLARPSLLSVRMLIQVAMIIAAEENLKMSRFLIDLAAQKALEW